MVLVIALHTGSYPGTFVLDGSFFGAPRVGVTQCFTYLVIVGSKQQQNVIECLRLCPGGGEGLDVAEAAGMVADFFVQLIPLPVCAVSHDKRWKCFLGNFSQAGDRKLARNPRSGKMS